MILAATHLQFTKFKTIFKLNMKLVTYDILCLHNKKNPLLVQQRYGQVLLGYSCFICKIILIYVSICLSFKNISILVLA